MRRHKGCLPIGRSAHTLSLMKEENDKYWPGTIAEIKENNAIILYKDALYILDEADQLNPESKYRNILARSATTNLLLAFEAYINAVYSYFHIPDENRPRTFRSKWVKAPSICLNGYFLKPITIINFNQESELFQKFSELIDIRNSIAHLKSSIHPVPVENMSKFQHPNELWPITNIPKHISLWEPKHSRKIQDLFNEMTLELDNLLFNETHLLRTEELLIEYILDKKDSIKM